MLCSFSLFFARILRLSFYEKFLFFYVVHRCILSSHSLRGTAHTQKRKGSCVCVVVLMIFITHVHTRSHIRYRLAVAPSLVPRKEKNGEEFEYNSIVNGKRNGMECERI